MLGWSIYAIDSVTTEQYKKSDNTPFEINALEACLVGFLH